MTPQAAESIKRLEVFFGFMFLVGFILLIMWFAALIDVIRSDFKRAENKTTWILLLIFLAPLAAILYPIFANRLKVEKEPKEKRKKAEVKRISNKLCSECGESMNTRKRQSGENKDCVYWVCSSYPTCKNMELIGEGKAGEWF